MSQFQRSIDAWMDAPHDSDCQRNILAHVRQDINRRTAIILRQKSGLPATSQEIQKASGYTTNSIIEFIQGGMESIHAMSGGYFRHQEEFAHASVWYQYFLPAHFYWNLFSVSEHALCQTQCAGHFVSHSLIPVYRQLENRYSSKMQRQRLDDAWKATLSNEGLPLSIQNCAAEGNFDEMEELIAYITKCVDREAKNPSKISRPTGKPLPASGLKSTRIVSVEDRQKSKDGWKEPSHSTDEVLAKHGFPMLLDLIAKWRSEQLSVLVPLLVLGGANYIDYTHHAWRELFVNPGSVYIQKGFITALKTIASTNSVRTLISNGLNAHMSKKERWAFADQIEKIVNQAAQEIRETSGETYPDSPGFQLIDPRDTEDDANRKKESTKQNAFPFDLLMAVTSGYLKHTVRNNVIASSYTLSWPETVEGTTTELIAFGKRFIDGERPTHEDLLAILHHLDRIFTSPDDWIGILHAQSCPSLL